MKRKVPMRLKGSKKRMILFAMMILISIAACSCSLKQKEEEASSDIDAAEETTEKGVSETAADNENNSEAENKSEAQKKSGDLENAESPDQAESTADSKAGDQKTGEEKMGDKNESDDQTEKEAFYISPITDDIFARIDGKSFKKECTVPRDDLRYLHVLHKDLDGKEHEGEMIVNYHIAEDVLDIFKELYKADYPIERIRLVDEYDADDEASMEDNNSSSFNFRFISHTTRVSKHGLGLAVDINTLYNPYTKVVDGERIIEPVTGEPYLNRKADFPYKIDEEDLCYKLFTKKGFEWGGNWTDRKDYQHFEIPSEQIAEWYPEDY